MFVKLKCNVSSNSKDYTLDDVVDLDDGLAEMLVERGDAEAPTKGEVDAAKAAAKAAADAAAKAAV